MPESGLDYTDSFDAKYAHNHCHTSMDPAFVRSFACLKVSVDGADLFVLELMQNNATSTPGWPVGSGSGQQILRNRDET